MEIEHISPSRKETWATCELKYKLRYHLKTPLPEPEKPYFTYGKIIHKIAEEYVRNQGSKSIGEVSTALKNGEILLDDRPCPPLPSGYGYKIGLHLSSLERLTEKIGFSGELEHHFELDLDPPNKKLLVGVIDRLMSTNKGYFILDYKTTRKGGKWQKTPKTIKNDLQLRCYSRAVQIIFGVKAEDIEAGLYYVDGTKSGPSLIRTRFTQESLLSAEKELLQAYNDIKNKNPDTAKGTIGWHCKYCDYTSVCPAMRKPQLPSALR